jgi:TonB family protein
MALHATFVAALYVFPISSTRQFAPAGQTRVISIEAVQPTPPATSFSEFQPDNAKPLPSDLDSPFDRMPKTERLDSRELAIARSESVTSDSSRLPMPSSLSQLPPDPPQMRKRPAPDQVLPEVTLTDMPPRPKSTHPVADPMISAAMTIEQFVGLDEDSAADLSGNRPPVYPLDAVRRRLQGVVLLQLRITAQGKVEDVKLIQSSGHPILDNAAIDAVASWQGRPARRWGQAVTSVERLPIRFRL